MIAPRCALDVPVVRRTAKLGGLPERDVCADSTVCGCGSQLRPGLRRQDGLGLAMLVAGLAATIALVGASHGALLDEAYCGQAPSWPLWSMREV